MGVGIVKGIARTSVVILLVVALTAGFSGFAFADGVDVRTPAGKEALYKVKLPSKLPARASDDPSIAKDPMKFYSLAYYLYDQGLDVWLANYRGRGREPSRSHALAQCVYSQRFNNLCEYYRNGPPGCQSIMPVAPNAKTRNPADRFKVMPGTAHLDLANGLRAPFQLFPLISKWIASLGSD